MPSTRTTQTKAARWNQLDTLAAEFGLQTWVHTLESDREILLQIGTKDEVIKTFRKRGLKIGVKQLSDAIAWLQSAPSQLLPTAAEEKEVDGNGQSFWAANRCILADARYRFGVPMAVAREYTEGNISMEEAQLVRA